MRIIVRHIDSHGQQAPAPILAGGSDHGRARHILVGIGHRVLEIEDDEVARQGPGLGERPRIGRGQKEGGADMVEWTDHEHRLTIALEDWRRLSRYLSTTVNFQVTVPLNR